ncbi:MAG: GWxTD domain-containing protein [Rhodothermales bacterium]|nr:GWxTD domain-containing protein [Rhodothermales bacterium]
MNRTRLLLLLVSLGFGLGGPARAQPQGTAARASAAIAAVEQGAAEAAIDPLEAVFEQDAAYAVPGQGTVAYWLGRAYADTGDPESALEVWREGLDALGETGLFDWRLADVFLRHVLDGRAGEEGDFGRATPLYLNLLAALEAVPPDAVAAMAQAHLHPLAYVVPDALLRETGLDAMEAGILPTPVDGGRLAAWWRSQDVLPATHYNERLDEHLRRVAHARHHYRTPEGTYDDRARVYIRLGPPDRRTEVRFDDTRFQGKVIQRNLTLLSSDFPENEFWVYERLDQAAQFLFYRHEGYYQLGEPMDLVPPTLRTGVGSSGRGQQKARAVVRTLEEIYRQLALHHTSFATRYTDVAAYSSLLDDSEAAAAANAEVATALQRTLVADPVSVNVEGSAFSADVPHLYAEKALMEGHVADEQAARRRETYVPRTATNLFDEVEPLPVVARTARFLDDDGTTRTEVYWGLTPGPLEDPQTLAEEPGDAYLIVGSVVQQLADHRNRVLRVERHTMPRRDGEAEAAREPQRYTAAGDTGRYHLAVQWDLYLATLGPDGVPVRLGAHLRRQSLRFDTLQALEATGGTLVMSDLKPMVLRDATATPDLAQAVPYPFDRVRPDTPLLLYFEVYHLAFGPDDRTHYTVEYEVTRPEGGALRLRRGREDGVSSRAAYEGTARTAPEYVALELGAWEGTGPLTVTVRVTDDVSGRQAERTLPLVMVR